MANPARELANILKAWGKTGDTTVKRRGLVNDRSYNTQHATFWRQVRPAVEYLIQVENSLDSLEAMGRDVSHFRAAVPAWYEAVFLPKHSWQSKQLHEVISAPDLRLLTSLADVIELAGVSPMGAAVDLTKVLRDLRALEREVAKSDLDPQIALRLAWHIQQARQFAENVDTFGEAVVLATVLTVATQSMQFADGATAEQAKSIKRLAKRLTEGVGSGLIVHGILTTAPHVGNAFLALTAGS